MTARRTGLGLAAMTGAAVLFAACGGAGGTPPTTTPPAPGPVASGSIAPASDALPSFALPGFSFALPSFTADKDLESMFPDTIGGETVTVLSMSGGDFVALGAASKDVQTALQQLGKTPADLSVGVGSTSTLTIYAFRIKGVPADQFLGKYLSSTAVGSSVTDASFGGKTVKKVTTNGQVAAYLYLSGEMLWTVGGASPSDALLTEAFSKLP
jgi:hypothetical protein